MTTFLTALLWGTGLSLGMCVGFITWAIFRRVILKASYDTHLAIQRESVELLQERNCLTVVTNKLVERIALACETDLLGDDEDEDSEAWKRN